jgi:hypothetical protein
MSQEEYVWCLHCEKVNKRGEWQGNECFCPEDGCNGHWGDDWDWGEVRKIHPEYPLKPIKGKKYPLYD